MIVGANGMTEYGLKLKTIDFLLLKYHDRVHLCENKP